MNRWTVTLGTALVLGAATAAHAVDFADPAGDAGSAPDITRVSAIADATTVTFTVRVANMPQLAQGAELFLPIDVDPNGAKGDQHGVDFIYSLRGGEPGLRTRRWNGAQHAVFDSTATGQVEAGIATFVVQIAELGSPAAVGFGAVGVLGADSDAAPANGDWTHRLRADRIRSIEARFSPAPPRAGRAFRVTSATARLESGATRRGATTCSTRVASAPLKGGRCVWTLPKTARAKTLTVTVRVRVDDVGSASRVYRFQIR